MTDKQIKQNAHDYTYTNDHNWTWDDSGESRVDISAEISDAYLAGAHSRDEELKELNDMVDGYREEASRLYERCNNLFFENNQLRNPWISVEDRLPEDDRDCLFMGNHIPVCFGTYYPNSLSGAVWSCDDGYWTPAKEVTHWMPIPELKEGE